jgi:hypothetical protein
MPPATQTSAIRRILANNESRDLPRPHKLDDTTHFVRVTRRPEPCDSARRSAVAKMSRNGNLMADPVRRNINVRIQAVPTRGEPRVARHIFTRGCTRSLIDGSATTSCANPARIPSGYWMPYPRRSGIRASTRRCWHRDCPDNRLVKSLPPSHSRRSPNS